MRQTLRVHPDSRGPAAMQIEAEVSRAGPGFLALRFFATGTLCDVLMPPLAAPARANELWQHTCFEAFLRAPSSTAYYEFNFAPSRQWAAYRFGDYRSGMRIATEIDVSNLEVRSSDDFLELRASMAIDEEADLPNDVPWRLGLSAVIEEARGRKSYWALKHPPGRPDFHHPDCFALELPAA